MAFDPQNFIRLSAGEVPAQQTGGCVSYFYESAADNLHDTGTGQLAPGYFNDVAKQLRFGSYIATVYRPTLPTAPVSALCVVTTNQPEAPDVHISRVSAPANVFPSPYYQVMAEAPLTYVTSGGNTDTVLFPESEVGFFATYSLNSGINDIGPPVAHSGIEFIECQAGQILIDYSRPVIAGQTVKLWIQLRTATPSP